MSGSQLHQSYFKDKRFLIFFIPRGTSWSRDVILVYSFGSCWYPKYRQSTQFTVLADPSSLTHLLWTLCSCTYFCVISTLYKSSILVNVLTISRNFPHLTDSCEELCSLFIWSFPSEKEKNSSTPTKSPREVWRLRCCGEYTSWFTRPQGCSIFSPVSRLSCTSSLSLSPCPFNFPQTLFFPHSHTSCLRFGSSSVYFLCVHKLTLIFFLTFSYTTVSNILRMKVKNLFLLHY